MDKIYRILHGHILSISKLHVLYDEINHTRKHQENLQTKFYVIMHYKRVLILSLFKLNTNS